MAKTWFITGAGRGLGAEIARAVLKAGDRAVATGRRRARQGRVFNLSSLGGIVGAQLYSPYCASKFAIEGFSESLAKEIAPFGLYVTIIEPGPFRTDFLKPESLRFGQTRLSDYDDRRAQLRAGLAARNGQQPGDPVKLADAILRLANEAEPPMRFLAGSIAVSAAEQKLTAVRAELERWRQLSTGTDGEFPSMSAAGLLDQIR